MFVIFAFAECKDLYSNVHYILYVIHLEKNPQLLNFFEHAPTINSY
jgi:hypothetical protein